MKRDNELAYTEPLKLNRVIWMTYFIIDAVNVMLGGNHNSHPHGICQINNMCISKYLVNMEIPNPKNKIHRLHGNNKCPITVATLVCNKLPSKITQIQYIKVFKNTLKTCC